MDAMNAMNGIQPYSLKKEKICLKRTMLIHRSSSDESEIGTGTVLELISTRWST